MLREAGDAGPVLAWLYGVEEDLLRWSRPMLMCRPTRSSRLAGWPLRLLPSERRARVHLKIDTGLSRNGATQLRLAACVRRGSRGRARRGHRSGGHLVAPRRSRRARPSVGSSSA